MQNTITQQGCLYVCGTPIGNLEDISLRALKILRQVDLVAAEDTRHTRKLLNHYDIKVELISYHEHNRYERGRELVGRITDGLQVALVSDAGMPGISDPGHDLIAAVLKAGLAVIPIPGPTAAVTALVVSGLKTDRFAFTGFLPRKRNERLAEIERLKSYPYTMIFYEAPHRLKATLKDMHEVLGNRNASVARELTKLYEENLRMPLQSLREHFENNEPRGEITLIVEGAGEGSLSYAPADIDLDELLQQLLAGGLSKSEAAREAASRTGLPRRELYKRML
ncbi:MAG: 16S rRNA (cytidine(1402)-2'-O)-methyltransferase [bacterium]|jgi:16S rRNA (cytidine1402-2'-O)-methyltransferase|nr:16S rRNA (cytidine(1402)-2'-O)-methyltransferase [bacterium]MDD3805908.1 16S rRNA (cytidine(1402)-2'-O)-methyltransferase [bacterium]MDD4558267.1 16S rRNA (cytidine(1402)-2'-O)-methyltransferase [bacterium]